MNNSEKLSARIHTVLARSYTVYFLLFLVGIFLDIMFKVDISFSHNIVILGIFLLVLASILIVWAQSTSRNLNKENLRKETFCRGPYCFTRSPTHWGLFVLMLGFGILANAIFVIIFTILAFLITKTVFLREEESLLVQKYGTPYLEYQKAVRF